MNPNDVKAATKVNANGGLTGASVSNPGKINCEFCVPGEIIKRGFKPDLITMSTLLEALCLDGKFFDAVELFDKLTESGFEDGSVDDAIKMIKQIIGNGICPDVIVYSSLINRLCSFNRLKEAVEYSDKMVARGISAELVNYNSLIHGFCRMGFCKESLKTEKAVSLFQEMLHKGLKPNKVGYDLLITELRQVG
ncbi:pentatricopeptide repeat-containing protein At1g62680, mitochondrial [Citrus clementina]|uniref:pentatricopeptide repeat-containing protein At1g62680, mitochondrial n=1 Tax=Citrus clementina TaxID=85681 RepID=UPI000CED5E5C|nr:pentatricopeptide repeat-containing protein At1g62680, mitochondrial [Citrus x clementina]